MGTEFPRDLDPEYLEKAKAYLECRTRGGDPPVRLIEAWDRFYDFYAPRILAFLARRGLPEADRNDCSQDVWKEVVTKLVQFRYDPGRGRLSTWLLTLARNKAVDVIRSRSRHPAEGLGDDDATAPRDPSPDPATTCERRWTQARVRRVLAELSAQVSETNSQLISLRWIEGRAVAEIAAALELTPEQVRFRIYRMKQRFRDLFERSREPEIGEGDLEAPQEEWCTNSGRHKIAGSAS